MSALAGRAIGYVIAGAGSPHDLGFENLAPVTGFTSPSHTVYVLTA